MIKHFSLISSIVLGAGMLAGTQSADASLVFHAGFDDGAGDPVGMYQGTPITGPLSHADFAYSTSVPAAVGGGHALYFPKTTAAPRNLGVTFTPPTPLNTLGFSSGTIAAWINMESFASTGGNRILSTRGANDALDFYIYRPGHASGKGGHIELHAGNGKGGFNTYHTGEAVFTSDQLGDWYFIAVSWDNDADEVSFYMGDESGTVNLINTVTGIDINPAGQSNIRIGGAGSTDSFHGFMDEFYLFNHALTHQELRQLALPEPASLALMGVGGMLVLRRRQQR